MKNSLSTQSLLNFRSSSYHIGPDSNQHSNTNQITLKPKILPLASKSIITQKKHQQTQNTQLNKKDIKEIYEYKIKQKAQLSKLSTRNPQQSFKKLPPSRQNLLSNDHKQIATLKHQNEKISKQLSDITKENKKLKKLLINTQNPKINHINISEAINTQKNYKKQVLSKLNQRQKLKTQMNSSVSKHPTHQANSSNNSKQSKKNNNKKSESKNNKRASSRSSITMNLNMSFVKMKSPCSSKNTQFVKNHSKEILDQIIRSNPRKGLLDFKDQSDQCLQLISAQQKKPTSIKSLFKELAQKKQVNLKDLEQFYSLSAKIFAEFNDLILFSKQTFTELLNKVDIHECYDSKKLQDSKHSMGQDMKMKTLLDKIHELYRTNITSNGKHNEINIKNYELDDNWSGKKINISQIEPDELLTPESSVISYPEMRHNPERKKSYEKYRLQKLNENLALIANFQNKKLRTQMTEAGTTQPKVYFSKPVSTHVSRKISFNNSFNNSLKDSKIIQ